MAQFIVEKSKLIQASAAEVYGLLRDFRQWPRWSPWLVAEPEAKLDFPEDGRSYAWDGDVIGAGSVHLQREEEPRELDHEIRFLRPWKATNPVTFRLTAEDGATRVTWRMTGSLPFFLFWMKGMMASWVGMDFERGLAMLADAAETGSVPSKVEKLGPQSFAGFRYVGIHSRCALGEVGPCMERDFTRLEAAMKEAGLCPDGKPFSIYHKWDLGKGETAYTIGLPVVAPPAELPKGLTSGEIPSCQTYDLRHTGPYRHLGNAWATAMMSRGKLFKSARGIDPFETYENQPGLTPENELITVVHMPVKS